MTEDWIPARGFPKYEVSTSGHVRNKKTGRVLKPGKLNNGYLVVTLMGEERRPVDHVGMTVHRLVCRSFHGEPPDESMHATHRNGDKTDNRPANLRWLTCKENEHDKRNHGTYPEGEGNGRAKLVEEQVLQIRSLFDAGIPREDIAQRFNITPIHVWQIGNRRAWKHLKDHG